MRTSFTRPFTGTPRGALVAAAVAVTAAALLVAWPPLHRVPDGTVAVRVNQFNGHFDLFGAGPLLALPGVHAVRELTLRERLSRPAASRRAGGEPPFRSVEGLSIGVDLAVRWSLDPEQVARVARTLPADIDAEVVAPAVLAVAHEVFARHTVREIFSARRAEIQRTIEVALKTRLAADGVLLRGLVLGAVHVPDEVRAGLDPLLVAARAEVEVQ